MVFVQYNLNTAVVSPCSHEPGSSGPLIMLGYSAGSRLPPPQIALLPTDAVTRRGWG